MNFLRIELLERRFTLLQWIEYFSIFDDSDGRGVFFHESEDAEQLVIFRFYEFYILWKLCLSPSLNYFRKAKEVTYMIKDSDVGFIRIRGVSEKLSKRSTRTDGPHEDPDC